MDAHEGAARAEAQGTASGAGAVAWSRVAVTALVLLLVYGALYVFAEVLAYRYGDRNPFFQAATIEGDARTLAILGSSRALPLTYGDAGAELASQLGVEVINLAFEGGGVLPATVVLDQLLEHRPPTAVLYVVDAFVFYSSEWNEERLADVRLWQRAPLDPALVSATWRATRDLGVPMGTFWTYLTGFTKINDPATWFVPDVWASEKDFETSYRPSSYRDTSRLEYLYGEAPAIDRDYVDAFVALARDLDARGIPLVVVRPPLREAYAERIPGQEAFDAEFEDLVRAEAIEYHDFSAIGLDEASFMDPDHLNVHGVAALREHLVPVLRTVLDEAGGEAARTRRIRPAVDPHVPGSTRFGGTIGSFGTPRRPPFATNGSAPFASTGPSSARSCHRTLES